MNKRIWKCDGGINIYGYLDDFNWGVCKLVNIPKPITLWGRGMNDLKGKIENHIEKELGLKIQYNTYVDKFPKPLLTLSPEFIKEKAKQSKYNRKRTAYMMRQPSGRFEGIHYTPCEIHIGDSKGVMINLTTGKTILMNKHDCNSLPSTALEFAKESPNGFFKYLHYIPNPVKIIGVHSEGGEEECELKISSDLKSFKIKQGLKILPVGYFDYFQSNFQSPNHSEWQPSVEKFLKSSTLHLDIF